jgi:hypothetical protein
LGYFPKRVYLKGVVGMREAVMIWESEDGEAGEEIVVTSANEGFIAAFRELGWKEDRGSAGKYRTFRVGLESVTFHGKGGSAGVGIGRILSRSGRSEVFDTQPIPPYTLDDFDASEAI